MKTEFKYKFQISKLIIFTVCYYTLGNNKKPHFATSADKFIKNKKDYERAGQCQNDILPKLSKAYKFFKKWDFLHLHDLTEEQHGEILKDIEELKKEYNYIYKDFSNLSKPYNDRIPFWQVVEFSKQEPKKK